MQTALIVLGLVVLAGVVLATSVSRKEKDSALGALSRETLSRDRSARTGQEPGVSAKEIEAAAVQARKASKQVVKSEATPAAYVPLDAEALGVTRRQFLNRGIVTLMGASIGAFGAAAIGFLRPTKVTGFGSKITLPDSLDEILATIESKKEPYYYGTGRLYIVPYPTETIDKAKDVYDGAVLAGMEQGVVALYQKCVHLGCRVPWCKTSQWFECPCHGSQYNRVGEYKAGPAPRGLDRFPLQIAGGKISIDTGLPVQGPAKGTNTTGQEAEGPHCK